MNTEVKDYIAQNGGKSRILEDISDAAIEMLELKEECCTTPITRCLIHLKEILNIAG